MRSTFLKFRIYIQLLLFSRSVVPNSLVTPWTVALQAPLSMRFPRQECWSGLPCPPPGDLPDPGFEPTSSALQADSLLLSHGEGPYSTVLSSISTVFTKQICKTFSSCMIEILYPLNSNSLSALPPRTLAVSILFCFCEFDCFWYLV